MTCPSPHMITGMSSTGRVAGAARRRRRPRRRAAPLSSCSRAERLLHVVEQLRVAGQRLGDRRVALGQPRGVPDHRREALARRAGRRRAPPRRSRRATRSARARAPRPASAWSGSGGRASRRRRPRAARPRRSGRRGRARRTPRRAASRMRSRLRRASARIARSARARRRRPQRRLSRRPTADAAVTVAVSAMACGASSRAKRNSDSGCARVADGTGLPLPICSLARPFAA